jgi:hypothetical protein
MKLDLFQMAHSNRIDIHKEVSAEADININLQWQELLTLPQHMSSPPVFIGVRVTRSLALYVCFVDHYLSFCTFSFGHCVVCSSSIHGF